MNKPMVYCTRKEDEEKKWSLSFYVRVGSESYYLFTTKYRMAVEEMFGRGITVERAIHMNFEKNEYVRNISTRLPSYLRYIEAEEEISVMPKENRKKAMKSEGVKHFFERMNHEERLEPEAL